MTRPAEPGAAPPEADRFSIPAVDAFIRELRESDGPLLEWHGGVDRRSFYKAQWQRHREGQATVLVVEWNSFPIAQAAIIWEGKPTHPGVPDIQSLRVFAAFRGMGIGTRLLEAAESRVAQGGHPHISLSVGIDNPRAQALYERSGYRPAGQPYFDEWSYTDSRGEEVLVGETILDMIKLLG